MASKAAVLINIIEARDLKPRASSGMADPLVVVEVFGEKLSTPVVKKDLSPYFDHFFHIEGKPKDSFSTEVLRVSVYDAGTFFRKELIGSFDFELADVHNQPNHERYKVWTLLTDHTDPSKKGVQGYLKLSVTVLKPGEQPVEHPETESDETDSADDNLSNMVLLKPKGLTDTDVILKVKTFKAANLPKMDTFGTCDPYLLVKYTRLAIQSSTVTKSQDPTWNEELQIPVTLPTMADNVVVSLYDFDVGAPGELIGTNIVSFKSIQNGTFSQPYWMNFYRGGGKKTEEFEFCGRALVALSTAATGDAKLVKIATAPEAEPLVCQYVVHFDVHEVQALHGSTQHYVTVAVGSNVGKSSHKHHEKGTAEIYEQISEMVLTFPTDTSQIPDIFVYLWEKPAIGPDKRIGFLRYKYDEISKVTDLPVWAPFKAIDNKESTELPGFIQFKLNMGPTATMKQVPRTLVKKPAKRSVQIRGHFYVGRNLPAGDEDALSDPYCVVKVGHVKVLTKVIPHTTAPDWYETIKLDLEIPVSLDLAPEIHIDIMDKDDITADDFLGRVVVPMSDASTDANLKAPKWYPLWRSKNIPGKGEILASFQVLSKDQAQSALPNLRPKMVDSQVEIGIVGLRNLVPNSLLPISNPYVKFSISGKSTVATKKSSDPSAKSPNYFENFVIPVQLPEIADQCPALLIEVFDTKPIKDGLIAVATVPLSQLVPWKPTGSKPAIITNVPPKVEAKEFYQAPAQEPLVSVSVPPITTLGLPTAPDYVSVDITPDSPAHTEKTSLLGNERGKSMVMSDINRPDVQETTVRGFEEEPEEPPRREVASEIEHQFKTFPFTEIDLFRGTSAGLSTGNIFNKHDRKVGKFKGAIHVRQLTNGKPEPAKLDVTILKKQRPFVLRVYVERAQNLVPKDDNGSSDPYLVLSTGKKNILNDRESFKKHTLQPEFWKMYTINGLLPEENELKIQMFDADDIGSDDLIGETRYDLEMLWFSDEWRKLAQKPIEFRTLWSPLSSFPQGKVKLFLELLTPEEAKNQPPAPFAAPVKRSFELRVVVWETRNVVPKDKILGKESSDQFVVSKLLGYPQAAQQTDVHDSVMDGCGKFNWRLVYNDVMLPFETPRLKIQVYDKDRVGPNDAIAEANLNMKGFFQKALKNGSARIGASGPAAQSAGTQITPLATAASSSTSGGPFGTGQWLDLFHPSHEGIQGTVCLEIDLLAVDDAKSKPAGKGRSEPNQFPYLPEPVRPKREWFSDFFKFFGLDKLKKYLIIAGVVLLLVLLLILILYFAI